MQRKLESQDLDIPCDDIDCWFKYPKHRWVYELSRLLDAQGIDWTPFESSGLVRELNVDMYSKSPLIKQPGFIYLKKPTGFHLQTEIYIVKGEIKFTRHIDPKTNQVYEETFGDIELLLNAFVILHFQKFTGVITTETYSNEIFRIRLRPHLTPSLEANNEISRLLKRIYKKQILNI